MSVEQTPLASSAQSGLGVPMVQAPFATNEDGDAIRLGEHVVPVYTWRGRRWVICADLDVPIGYAPGGVADMIQGPWNAELRRSEHYDVLKGADLEAFKSQFATGKSPVANKVRCITLVSEAGLDTICLLTNKPVGVRLRAYSSNEVYPELRRGNVVNPPPGVVGRAPAAVPSSRPYWAFPRCRRRRPPPTSEPGDAIRLGEHVVPVCTWRGKLWVICGDLDVPRGYQPGGVADMIQGPWSAELRRGAHYVVLAGDDLREFKAIQALTGESPVSGAVSCRTPSLTLVSEPGSTRSACSPTRPSA